MELLELVINDEDESGVDFIALVDAPAVEKLWLAFNKQKDVDFQFKIQDQEKRIVSGFFMIADLPIVRSNDQGEKFYVVFKKDTINKIVNKFFKHGYSNNINIMHNKNDEADGVYVIESLIIDKERGINTPQGFDEVPDGSWWGSMRVENNELWEQIKAGVFNGFSVEGLFGQDNGRELKEKIITRIRDVIKNYKNK
jgi:predicted secreted protein